MDASSFESTLLRFYGLRLRCFSGISAMSGLRKLSLSIGMACATGIAAQFRLHLPWTPVPVTGQTLAVLLSGVFLGAKWGAGSQVIYLLLGAAGMPWFSGWSGGGAYLLGPTGGYIAGFIPAAFAAGFFSDRNPRARCFLPMVLIMSSANFLLLHLFGLVHLSIWAGVTGAPFAGAGALLSSSLLPFIPGDAMKIAAAALAVKAFAPKERV